MKTKHLRALIAGLATAPMVSMSAHATLSDQDLGISWAKCSMQAKLLQEVAFKKEKIDTSEVYRKVSAYLHIHAIAAAGEDVTEAARQKERSHFIRNAMGQNLAEFASSYIAISSKSVDSCMKSISENRDRLRNDVQEIIRKSKQ